MIYSNPSIALLHQFVYTLNIHMHEISMHFDSEDDTNNPADNKKSATTAFQIQSLTSCLSSIHKTIDLITSLDMHYMLSLPTIVLARTSYAAVSLMKLFSFVASHKDDIGQVLDPASLKVEYYLDNVIEYYRKAGELEGGRTATRFSLVLSMMRNWFVKRREQTATADTNEAVGTKVRIRSLNIHVFQYTDPLHTEAE